MTGISGSNRLDGIPATLRIWIEARTRYRLSHAHVQMARELGLNPKKLGGMANHAQEPWKAPLPEYLEYLYQKRFGKPRPDCVLSIEELVKRDRKKREERAQRKRQKRRELKAQPSAQSAPEPEQDGDLSF